MRSRSRWKSVAGRRGGSRARAAGRRAWTAYGASPLSAWLTVAAGGESGFERLRRHGALDRAADALQHDEADLAASPSCRRASTRSPPLGSGRRSASAARRCTACRSPRHRRARSIPAAERGRCSTCRSRRPRRAASARSRSAPRCMAEGVPEVQQGTLALPSRLGDDRALISQERASRRSAAVPGRQAAAADHA